MTWRDLRKAVKRAGGVLARKNPPTTWDTPRVRWWVAEIALIGCIAVVWFTDAHWAVYGAMALVSWATTVQERTNYPPRRPHADTSD